MADSKALFNNKNKIRISDLDVELSSAITNGLLTEEDRRKLNSLTSDGSATKVNNPIDINLNGNIISYDGSEKRTIDINPDTIGASKVSHNHDDRYSKSDHEHNYAGSDTPNGIANSAKRLNHPISISIKGAVEGSVTGNDDTVLEVNTTVNHEHNYAGSDVPGGVANSAKRLSAPIKINLTGAVTGTVDMDGSENVEIETSFNSSNFPEVLDGNLK